MREVRARADEIREFRIELLRHDQHARAAVGKHEAVVVLGHQRVDRHRDDAGLDGAEESRRPIDGVEQREQHAFFAPHAERAQHMAEALDAVGELAVAPCPVRIDEGGLAGAAGGEISVQDIGREIVVARDRIGGRRGRQRSRIDRHRGVSPQDKHYAEGEICRNAIVAETKG